MFVVADLGITADSGTVADGHVSSEEDTKWSVKRRFRVAAPRLFRQRASWTGTGGCFFCSGWRGRREHVLLCVSLPAAKRRAAARRDVRATFESRGRW